MRTLRNYFKHQDNQQTVLMPKKKKGVHNCHYKFIINHSKYLLSKGKVVTVS